MSRESTCITNENHRRWCERRLLCQHEIPSSCVKFLLKDLEIPGYRQFIHAASKPNSSNTEFS
ncbi:hypothetical protein Mapa_016932 [Marchantia paleacea]|nr:hypothetical protein Mapa_016932 [Marchantia paleacea]